MNCYFRCVTPVDTMMLISSDYYTSCSAGDSFMIFICLGNAIKRN